MSAYKDKKAGKWVVTLRYTDIDGKKKRRAKRGFLTKRETKDWESEFLASLNTEIEIEINLTHNEFYNIYLSDISNKLRQNTVKNKRVIYNKYIGPYLGSKKINKISTPDIIKWQNEIIGFNFKDT